MRASLAPPTGDRRGSYTRIQSLTLRHGGRLKALLGGKFEGLAVKRANWADAEATDDHFGDRGGADMPKQL